ncbi:XRE family transcriptional regulator [Mesorhizobium sp. NZP2077]|nr:helix-turn-helix transcriptional regulator [Mesorhizobium sp. NZP2077]QKC85376.1 XRE family transcriptional regulator [Mesorhizobium sp. NZP2077]QKD20293.1 helix-turn-helix transcriptional regulator [Mesorhizobium sp. NZP2077]
MTVEQCRAARALLDWSQARLSAKAQVSEGTVRDFEKSKRVPAGDVLVALRSALELAGVAFLRDGETVHGGPGVRFSTSTASRTPIQDGEAGIIQNSDM